MICNLFFERLVREFAGALLVVLALGAAMPATAADASLLSGAWEGEAVLNGDRTRIEAEFLPCDKGVCGRWSMPDLNYFWRPTGPVTLDDNGGVGAGALNGVLKDGVMPGEFGGHRGGYIDAMPHGKTASFTLRRGRVTPIPATVQPISFHNGDILLSGTFVRPNGRGPFPTIIFVHGSGASDRWYAFGQALTLARQGYASVVYDKRGVGESGGDWTNASLDDLAGDVAAAARFAAALKDVDPKRMGLRGHSQGGWVVPRALRLGAPASFAIVLAGGGATPRQVELFGYNQTLDHVGADGAGRAKAAILLDSYFDYLAGKISYEAVQAKLKDNEGEPWFGPLGLSRVLPDAAAQPKWTWVADYDPADDIAHLNLPLLLVMAGDDEAGPVLTSIGRWNAALSAGQAKQTRLVVIPKSSHHFRRGAGGWLREAKEFQSTLTTWLAETVPIR